MLVCPNRGPKNLAPLQDKREKGEEEGATAGPHTERGLGLGSRAEEEGSSTRTTMDLQCCVEADIARRSWWFAAVFVDPWLGSHVM